jgi:hypothetical protein
MNQDSPRPLLDSITLTAVLATAGAAVLFWTPVLVLWMTLATLRRHLSRHMRSRDELSLVG